MKIILQENIKGVGQKGEVKEVKDGYAMNFLIPQGKASAATVTNTKQAVLETKKRQEKLQEELRNNKEAAKNIANKKISVKVKAQKEKLFGALTEKDIQNVLQNEKINIGSGKIVLENPIKKLGQFDIAINWGEEIQETFKLNVIEES